MAKDGKRTFRNFEDMGVALGRKIDEPNDKAETGLQQTQNSEQSASDILSYLADELGTTSVGESEISQEQIAQELHARFGAYDPNNVSAYWERLKKSPSTIENPILRSIADDAQKMTGTDMSYIGNIIFFVDPAWVPIRNQIKELEATADIQVKKTLLTNLEDEINTILQDRKYETSSLKGGDRPLSLGDFRGPIDDLTINIKRGSYSGFLNLDDVALALQRTHFQIRFDEKLGSIDRGELQANTLTFGAKGAHLEVLKRIKEGLEDFGIFINIPEFRQIPVAVYDKQVSAQKIQGDVQDIYE